MFLRPGCQRHMVSNDNIGRATQEKQVTSFSQVAAKASPTRLISHTNSHKSFVLSMVGRRCVVQECTNCSNRVAGIGLHANPTDRTRDGWVDPVFSPARFAIWSVYFEEHSSIRHKSAPTNYTWIYGKGGAINRS